MPNLLPSDVNAAAGRGEIVLSGRHKVSQTAGQAIVLTYWELGRYLVEQEQRGEDPEVLADRLCQVMMPRFGADFSISNLLEFRKFFLMFPKGEIWQAYLPDLTWGHIRSLLKVADEDARLWYLRESVREGWGARVLEHHVLTQYYYHLKQSSDQDALVAQLRRGNTQNEGDKTEGAVRFDGFKKPDPRTKSLKEQSLLARLRDYLLDLERGLAYVGADKYLSTAGGDGYVDMVFYSIEQQCYVLVNVKSGKLEDQDVAQLDVMARGYDALKCLHGENPTVGMLLSADGDECVRYTVPSDLGGTYLTKYRTLLPSTEQLKALQADS